MSGRVVEWGGWGRGVAFVARLLVSLSAVAACGTNDTRTTDGVTSLLVIDSVAIVETDSVFVGRPNAIAVDATGRLYIADGAAKRVLRVDRDGTGLVPMTREGSGPGEVRRPTSLALMGDSVLAVYDGEQRRLAFFDRASMEARGAFAIGGFNTSIRGWRDGLVVGALMVDSGTAFALVRDTVSAPARGGSVPRIYTEYPPIAQAFGAVEVARDDSVVVGVFEAAGTMYRWHLGSSATDSITLDAGGVPNAKRGAKPDVMLELLRDPSKASTLAFTWSFPMLVGVLSADRSALVTHDPTLSGNNFTGPAHVQVVDWRTRKSCREIMLPVSAEIPGRYALRGDTLIALVQHADGSGAGGEEGTGASTWMLRWVIGSARC